MHLTVLICTHDRVALLERLLLSLNACIRPESTVVDLLVVANACQDGTHSALQAYRARAGQDGLLPLAWIAEPAPGKSHALNAGVRALRCEWVAIVDDDHRVSEDFLVRVADAAAAYPQATMLCGRVLPDWDGREPTWVHDQGRYRIYPLPIPRQDFGPSARELTADGPIPGGGNQIIRVDVLRRAGAFSTDLGPRGHDLGGGEDTEYMLRSLGAGERLWYEPRVLQYHYVDPDRLTLPYLMRKAYHRSASVVAIRATESGAEWNRQGVPLYLYRKLIAYAAGVLASLSADRRRFYLVRSAAALGEMHAHRRLRGSASATSSIAARSDHA